MRTINISIPRFASAAVTFAAETLFLRADGTYPRRVQTVALDGNGTATIDLDTPDVGAAWYRVTLPDRSSYRISVAAGDPVDLHTLIDAEIILPSAASLLESRVQALETSGGGGGVTDHGALTGLSDDDHPQYALADGTRGAFATAADLSSKVDTTDPRLSDARTPTAHTHAIADTTGLQAALDGKANTTHSHAISDVTGLQAALDGKAAATHVHPEYAPRGPTVLWIEDDFVSGTTTSGTVGALGWSYTNGTLAVQSGGVSAHPGVVNRVTGGTAATNATMTLRSGTIGATQTAESFDATWVLRLASNDTDTAVRIGLTEAGTIANPPTNGMYIEKLYADTAWFAVCRAAGTETRTATGITIASTPWPRIRIRRVGASTIGFSIDGGTEITITTNIPASGIVLNPFVQIVNQTAVSKSIEIDYFSLYISGLAR